MDAVWNDLDLHNLNHYSNIDPQPGSTSAGGGNNHFNKNQAGYDQNNPGQGE